MGEVLKHGWTGGISEVFYVLTDISIDKRNLQAVGFNECGVIIKD
ncbi:MAG: hypothetical protein ACOX4Q_02685 [Syntrophomonadales bacterium]